MPMKLHLEEARCTCCFQQIWLRIRTPSSSPLQASPSIASRLCWRGGKHKHTSSFTVYRLRARAELTQWSEPLTTREALGVSP